MWILIVLGGVVMLALAAAMAYLLGQANRAWQVHENPLIVRVQDALAGLDCGQCGYPSCNAYAHAIVEQDEAIAKCTPGGQATVEALADILDREPMTVGAKFAVVHCGAHPAHKAGLSEYRGEPTCAAAETTVAGQACTFGCLGLGDCQRACPFDAIHVIDGLATVAYCKCTACGACVRACPRDIITIKPFPADDRIVVACCNTDPGRETRAVCRVGCIACGRCAKACELFTVARNLSRLDLSDYRPADHDAALAAASRACPTDCLPQVGTSTDAPVQLPQEGNAP